MTNTISGLPKCVISGKLRLVRGFKINPDLAKGLGFSLKTKHINLREGLTLQKAAELIGAKVDDLNTLGISLNGIDLRTLRSAIAEDKVRLKIKLRDRDDTRMEYYRFWIYHAIVGRLGKEEEALKFSIEILTDNMLGAIMNGQVPEMPQERTDFYNNYFETAANFFKEIEWNDANPKHMLLFGLLQFFPLQIPKKQSALVVNDLAFSIIKRLLERDSSVQDPAIWGEFFAFLWSDAVRLYAFPNDEEIILRAINLLYGNDLESWGKAVAASYKTLTEKLDWRFGYGPIHTLPNNRTTIMDRIKKIVNILESVEEACKTEYITAAQEQVNGLFPE